MPLKTTIVPAPTATHTYPLSFVGILIATGKYEGRNGFIYVVYGSFPRTEAPQQGVFVIETNGKVRPTRIAVGSGLTDSSLYYRRLPDDFPITL